MSSRSSAPITIVGIDPGTNRTGFGVITVGARGETKLVDHGCIVTLAGVPLADRLATIQEDIRQVLTAAAPTAVAVERLFFSRNTSSALDVGHARGVVLAACAERGIPVFEYTPPEIKQALTGYGSAGKEQVRAMVQRLLALDFLPEPDDVSDALAVALCHAHTVAWKNATHAPALQK